MTPADLRGMLRVEAVSLVLGLLMLAAGLVTIAVSAGRRQRAASLLWPVRGDGPVRRA